MTASHLSGPLMVYGQATGNTSTESNPQMGPSGFLQGTALLDPRLPYNPGVTGAGKIPAFLASPDYVTTDAIPATAGAAKIAAAQTATSGTALALATSVSAGVSPGLLIVPYGKAPIASNLVLTTGLDVGFATGNTTAGSTSITSVAGELRRLKAGLNVLVFGGSSGAAVLTTITAVSGTTITVANAMGATVSGAVIALANATGLVSARPICYTNMLTAGAGAFLDPRGSIARGVSLTSNSASDTGWTATINGYDVFMQPQSEALALTANAVTYSNKTYKAIASITATKGGGGTSVGTLSVGTSDLFGFGLRVDEWEMVNAFWAGAFLSASTGFTVADGTSPATVSTGDVRGTIQLSAAGPSGSYATGGAPNGSRRLMLATSIPLDALVAATYADASALTGVVPV